MNIIHDLMNNATKSIEINNRKYDIIIIPNKRRKGKVYKINAIPNVESRIEFRPFDFSRLSKKRVDYIFSDEFSTIDKKFEYIDRMDMYHSGDNIKILKDSSNVTFYVEFGTLVYGFIFKEQYVYIYRLDLYYSVLGNYVILQDNSVIINDLRVNGYVIEYMNDICTFFDIGTFEIIDFDFKDTKYIKYQRFHVFPNGEMFVEIYKDHVPIYYYLDKLYFGRIENLLLCIKTLEKRIHPPKPIKQMIVNMYCQEQIVLTN